MRIFAILIIILFIILNNKPIIAQDDEDINIAEEMIYSEDFEQAIEIYHKILETDPKNPDFNFKLGFCYMNTILKKEKSIRYFLASIAHTPKRQKKKFIYQERHFYLGRAYRINLKFDSAEIIFSELKEKATNKKFIKIINRELELCANGKYFMSNKVNFSSTNLGAVINSPFDDHSPIVPADESFIIFTSRRHAPGKEIFADNQYDEDIYYSLKTDSGWSKPKSMVTLNTDMHDATVSISFDGQELFMYRDEDEGTIYTSKLEGNKWTTPEKLNKNINTSYKETHACLSLDRTKLYFTSDRPGGYGGLDIYVAEKQDNDEWGVPKNLGATINTSEDEESPFIQADGKRLYFSSVGHLGLGGYDIFYSNLDSVGQWTKPVNLGYPINNIQDDRFFAVTLDGNRAYYATQQTSACFGKADIYLLSLPELESTEFSVITGRIVATNDKIPDTKISIFNQKKQIQQIVRANKKTGKYSFAVKQGETYSIKIEANGTVAFQESINIPKDTLFMFNYKTLRIEPKDTSKVVTINENYDNENPDEFGKLYDLKISIPNILFDYGKANEIPSNKTLDSLANYLKKNKDAVIEIGAYADSKGKADFNYTLSLKRGESVKKYLISKGAKSDQLSVVAYGEENPIAINKNPNGTWNLEAQKFNRRIEFRVLIQGEQTLQIRPISNIPENLKNKNYDKYYRKNRINIEIDY